MIPCLNIVPIHEEVDDPERQVNGGCRQIQLSRHLKKSGFQVKNENQCMGKSCFQNVPYLCTPLNQVLTTCQLRRLNRIKLVLEQRDNEPTRLGMIGYTDLDEFSE